MKKTIKQLEQDLEHAQVSRDEYYEKWQELEEKERKNNSLEIMGLRSELGTSMNKERGLMEIIKWLINPEAIKLEIEAKLEFDKKNNFRN